MGGLRRLLSNLTHPLFVFLDTLGVISWLGTVYLPSQWQPFFITLGSALITIGITLPAAVFFQSVQNEDAFNILNACYRSGIESIFTSRKQDSTGFHRALTSSLKESREISLLGVAFRAFFDPSGETRDGLSEIVNSPEKILKVLILDPKCTAALERDEVEIGNAVIADINHTISNGLVAAIIERIRHLQKKSPDFDFCKPENRSDVLKTLNLSIHTYETQPVAQVIRCDKSLFCEQYHLGRPEEIVPVGSCIGKYMPITEFRKGSYGYRFMECHFDFIWEKSKDLTPELFDLALKKFPMVCRH